MDKAWAHGDRRKHAPPKIHLFFVFAHFLYNHVFCLLEEQDPHGKGSLKYIWMGYEMRFLTFSRRASDPSNVYSLWFVFVSQV